MTRDIADQARERLFALRTRLEGRAAGAWEVSVDRLEQVAFDPAADLPTAVAEGFASATLVVEMVRLDLGIVRAATSGEVVVSVARELSGAVGSGYWLRAFGASRSVAVPILDRDGRVTLVVAVALGVEPDDVAVAAAIRAEPWSA